MKPVRIHRVADDVEEAWRAAWPRALAVWSPFTQLRAPVFCRTEKQEKAEGLTESFAMIRLQDHTVVISMAQVIKRGLEDFALEILAHEIGHHVLAPADLRDNARLLARIRRGLPTRESYAPMVSNLYTDLLINDRLQRQEELRIDEVYKKLRIDEPDKVWSIYMRTYEILWGLDRGTLIDDFDDAGMQTDAYLASRLVRVYGRDWLAGGGRFASLLLPYLLEQTSGPALAPLIPWMDTRDAGAGDEIPDGLVGIDADELEGTIHPASDPLISGIDADVSKAEHPGKAGGREQVGGQKNEYRDPNEYLELMRSLGVDVDARDLTIRYYKERARPHLVPFPSREVREASDPLPEGLDPWDVGSPVDRIDWVQSVVRSPFIVPGVTTVERSWGTTEGGEPDRQPIDLYLGIDCSGSMKNPSVSLSYPVVAGAVITLSALRAGAKVKACLSGEPGEYSQTDGFVRDQREVLNILTGYLGTGYAFGILRLEETFLKKDPPSRPTHILVVSDADIFYMIKQVKTGWDIARDAVVAAGGGATFVLDLPRTDPYEKDIARLRSFGWDFHFVRNREELVAFAHAFARLKYADEDRR